MVWKEDDGLFHHVQNYKSYLVWLKKLLILYYDVN